MDHSVLRPRASRGRGGQGICCWETNMRRPLDDTTQGWGLGDWLDQEPQDARGDEVSGSLNLDRTLVISPHIGRRWMQEERDTMLSMVRAEHLKTDRELSSNFMTLYPERSSNSSQSKQVVTVPPTPVLNTWHAWTYPSCPHRLVSSSIL